MATLVLGAAGAAIGGSIGAANPVVCRRAMPNSTFIVRQV